MADTLAEKGGFALEKPGNKPTQVIKEQKAVADKLFKDMMPLMYPPKYPIEVVFSDGKVVGAAAYERHGHTVTISHVAVDEHRQGFVTKLMNSSWMRTRRPIHKSFTLS